LNGGIGNEEIMDGSFGIFVLRRFIDARHGNGGGTSV
jgi:hypothetical protein